MFRGMGDLPGHSRPLLLFRPPVCSLALPAANPLKNYLDKPGSVPTFARYKLFTNRTAKSVQRLKSGNYEERSSPKKLPPRGVQGYE